MKHKYEGMIVIDTKGKEEGIDQLVSAVSKEMEKAGAKLEQIDQLGKRNLPYSPRHVTAAHFVNIQFEADSPALDAIKAKLQLNENIYQQYYQRAS